MIMNKSTSRILLGAAIVGMMSGAVVVSTPAQADTVKCYGVNECKGKTACHTSLNECKGQNACKGKGYLEMTKKECKKKGGSLTEKV